MKSRTSLAFFLSLLFAPLTITDCIADSMHMLVEVQGDSTIVRHSPNPGDQILAAVPENSRLIFLGPTRNEGWLQVRMPTSLEVGYITEASAKIKTVKVAETRTSMSVPPTTQAPALRDKKFPEFGMPNGAVPYDYNGTRYFIIPLNSDSMSQSSE